MWLLFHRKAKTRTVPGGERFTDTCPDCNARATFTEVEVTEKLGMFFVDVVGDTQRAFRCSSCEAVFDRKDDGAPAPSPPVEQKSAKQLAREAQEREAKRAEATERLTAKIDDELAELKKRLGR